MGSESRIQRKPRILCLHGFRTSGAILKKHVEKWPTSVLNRFDFHFMDAPFLSRGKSEVEGLHDPPYFEWFQFHEVHKSLFLFNSLQFHNSISIDSISGHGRFCKCRGMPSIHRESHARARTIRRTTRLLTGNN